MNGSVKERLIEYLSYKGVSKATFGRSIGVSGAYVTSIRKSIDKDKLQSIALHYPDLNIEWLLYGEGSMLKEDSQQNVPIPKDLERNYQDRISALEEKVQMLNETIAAQKQIIEDQKWLIDSLRSQIVRLEAKKTETTSVCRPGVKTDGDSLSSPKDV